ncbi:unnamed protein product [Caenorhabditis angaria]|uniref:Uncharacterized protein n=1 Tax=Caenorhabditis angaria TaxID=860376 RepID=A0A9P1J3L7_9PELO|nr:unnamed protein product [Caenorhabditis angaria]
MSLVSNTQITPMDVPPQCSSTNNSQVSIDVEAQNQPIKKKRTVTFAEMDPSQLDVNAQKLYTIIPPPKYDDSDSDDDDQSRYHRMMLFVKMGVIGFFVFICILIFVVILGNSAAVAAAASSTTTTPLGR